MGRETQKDMVSQGLGQAWVLGVERIQWVDTGRWLNGGKTFPYTSSAKSKLFIQVS